MTPTSQTGILRFHQAKTLYEEEDALIQNKTDKKTYSIIIV